VLGADGVSVVYDAYDGGSFSIFELGSSGGGASDVAATTLFRHGNYDDVNHAVSWDPRTESRSLPPSLYRMAAPGFWPARAPWPWAGSDLSPMVGALPAKVRADGMP